jgi:hypothetical protein
LPATNERAFAIYERMLGSGERGVPGHHYEPALGRWGESGFDAPGPRPVLTRGALDDRRPPPKPSPSSIRTHQVRVDALDQRERGVAENLRYEHRVHTLPEHVRGCRMLERVGMHPFGDPRCLGQVADELMHAAPGARDRRSLSAMSSRRSCTSSPTRTPLSASTRTIRASRSLLAVSSIRLTSSQVSVSTSFLGSRGSLTSTSTSSPSSFAQARKRLAALA